MRIACPGVGAYSIPRNSRLQSTMNWPTRTCTQCRARKQLFAYVHRLLEPVQEQLMRPHVESCSLCRETAEQFVKVDRLLDEWRVEQFQGF